MPPLEALSLSARFESFSSSRTKPGRRYSSPSRATAISLYKFFSPLLRCAGVCSSANISANLMAWRERWLAWWADEAGVLMDAAHMDTNRLRSLDVLDEGGRRRATCPSALIEQQQHVVACRELRHARHLSTGGTGLSAIFVHLLQPADP